MIKQKMIEKEEELVCSMNHKLPIYMVVLDKNLVRNQRLLCTECMDNLESNLNNVKGFKKVVQLIEENQKNKVDIVENVITINIKLIEKLQKILHQLKSYIIQQLDQLIGNTDKWINDLQKIAQQNVTYSFYEQLDILINQQLNQQFNQKPFLDQIQISNDSWKQKILKYLNQFKSFEFSSNCEQILNHLQNINSLNNHNNTQLQLQQVQDNQEQQLIQSNIQFNLIDDFNKQISSSYAIVFNNSGSIMISIEAKEILVWKFIQGKLNLSNRFQVHKDNVYCLVYSKKMNSFISGSYDNSIICWKQINMNEWKWSQPYKQHKNWISFLLLNKQENQLISGGRDDQIIVWKVDFINNELSYLYTLDNTKIVYSLSMNQSETILASCAQSRFLIWKKGLEGKWELQCTQSVTDGYQIKFINDQQFIWVTKDKNIDEILIFELIDGVFKQNKDKTIQLNKNDQCEDNWIVSPIVYNKDKNIILIRHKHHIYIIRKVNDCGFKIIGQLNCEIKYIYGTMTDTLSFNKLVI